MSVSLPVRYIGADVAPEGFILSGNGICDMDMFEEVPLIEVKKLKDSKKSKHHRHHRHKPKKFPHSHPPPQPTNTKDGYETSVDTLTSTGSLNSSSRSDIFSSGELEKSTRVKTPASSGYSSSVEAIQHLDETWPEDEGKLKPVEEDGGHGSEEASAQKREEENKAPVNKQWDTAYVSFA